MHKFNAEVSKVLKLVIHSLYTNKDVFLRELISNASDACEKARYLEASGTLQIDGGLKPKIRIALNEKEGFITVSDNGIGMNKDELIKHLGTIAKSGTEDFLKQAEAANKATASELIGQFGVGFYSCFMVSDKVEVRTKRRGEDEAKGYIWSSDGVSGFDIKEDDKIDFGTEIKVFIKDSEKEDYLDRFRVENIIKTYSNHISVPIEYAGEDDVITQINPEKALWMRKRSEITDEQYENFYHSVCHMPGKPWAVLHNKVEGNMEFTNLLFIPSTKPFDLYHQDMLTRIKLYVRHVFISERDIDIIPTYLRFVYGIVDSNDLPLNVSRETLQDNKTISKIKDTLVKKIFGELKDRAQKKPEEYEEFWKNFGPVLKEGLCDSIADRETLMSLTRFYTSKSRDKLIGFDDYISGMKAEQKDIYFFVGENINDMMSAPEMEVFLKNDVEVILLTDVVDGFWTNVIHDHAGKDLKSITRADVDLKDIEKSEKDNKNEDYTDEEKAMTDIFAKVLQGKVVAVKIATKLVDSPSCLSVAPGAMDSRMEDFLVAQNQLKKRSLKILEINPKNELVKRTYELLKNTINSNTVSSNTTNSNANSEHHDVDLTNANKDGIELATMIYELAVIGQGDHLENAGSAVKRILKYIK